MTTKYKRNIVRTSKLRNDIWIQKISDNFVKTKLKAWTIRISYCSIFILVHYHSMNKGHIFIYAFLVVYVNFYWKLTVSFLIPFLTNEPLMRHIFKCNYWWIQMYINFAICICKLMVLHHSKVLVGQRGDGLKISVSQNIVTFFYNYYEIKRNVMWRVII